MKRFRNRRLKYLALAAMMLVTSGMSANAESVGFDKQWDEVSFRRIPQTSYSFFGEYLSIRSAKSSSVIYRAVPESLRQSLAAGWEWSVEQSVPPTNLAKKGGDDRNIALYFVFTDKKTAARAGKNANIKRLLASRKSRLLIYVFGGNQDIGSFVPSPYFKGRGTSIIKRKAEPGSFREKVDLAADFRRAFNEEPSVLIGLAVSSDSDDSGASAQASLGAIHLWPEFR